jgi:hypothetical protein
VKYTAAAIRSGDGLSAGRTPSLMLADQPIDERFCGGVPESAATSDAQLLRLLASSEFVWRECIVLIVAERGGALVFIDSEDRTSIIDECIPPRTTRPVTGERLTESLDQERRGEVNFIRERGAHDVGVWI